MSVTNTVNALMNHHHTDIDTRFAVKMRVCFSLFFPSENTRISQGVHTQHYIVVCTKKTVDEQITIAKTQRNKRHTKYTVDRIK